MNVKNKKILRVLAGKTYRGNLRQNLMMILSIAMTAFLITVVFSLGVSYYKTVTERNLASAGVRYDIALPEPTDEQIQKTREFDGVKYAGLSVKCAVADTGDNAGRIRLYWADETCWEEQCKPAYVRWEGHYPENENEIMLSQQSLSELGIDRPECGMKISLTWSSLFAESDLQDCGTIFQLTGWFEEYNNHNNGYISKSFYEKTGVKQTDITNGLLYISLDNPLYSNTYIKKLGGSDWPYGKPGDLQRCLSADRLYQIGCRTCIPDRYDADQRLSVCLQCLLYFSCQGDQGLWTV